MALTFTNLPEIKIENLPEFKFEDLPKAVRFLTKEVSEIKHLLLARCINSSEPVEELFIVPQAAEFLSLAVPTIYSMVSRGELPVMKRGKRLYFSRLDLIDYLKQGRKKTITEAVSEASQYLINKKKGLNHGR